MTHEHEHCDSHGHCHHHHHESCCCGHEEHEHSCCHEGHHHDHESCDFSSQLLEMADEAWMELLHEKIKANIAASNGQQLDQLAKLVSDTNNARWKGKLGAKKGCADFKDKVNDFFNHS